jgi:hypothetical protein
VVQDFHSPLWNSIYVLAAIIGIGDVISLDLFDLPGIVAFLLAVRKVTRG